MARLTTNPEIPLNRSENEYVFIEQSTLRDLFAAFALAGIAAANMDQDYSTDAAMAYGYADAMLVQRQKEDDD